jgi:hypothetical protein
VTVRQPKVHTQLGRAEVQVFAANERMNQMVIKDFYPAAWMVKAPGHTRAMAAIITHMHNVRSKWVRLTAPHLKVPLNRVHCSQQQARVGWRRAPLAANRCSLKRSPGVGVASRSFAETAGLGLGRLARKCCATCSLMKPPSRAGVYAGPSTRIPVVERGGIRDLELGKVVERVRGRLVAPAMLLKESLEATEPHIFSGRLFHQPPPR